MGYNVPRSTLVRLGVNIAHAIRCNPIHFSMVSSDDFQAWVAALYSKIGYKISAKEIEEMYSHNIANEFPPESPRMKQYLFHRRDL